MRGMATFCTSAAVSMALIDLGDNPLRACLTGAVAGFAAWYALWRPRDH